MQSHPQFAPVSHAFERISSHRTCYPHYVENHAPKQHAGHFLFVVFRSQLTAAHSQFLVARVTIVESALTNVYENKRFQVEQNPHLRETGGRDEIAGASARTSVALRLRLASDHSPAVRATLVRPLSTLTSSQPQCNHLKLFDLHLSWQSLTARSPAPGVVGSRLEIGARRVNARRPTCISFRKLSGVASAARA